MGLPTGGVGVEREQGAGEAGVGADGAQVRLPGAGHQDPSTGHLGVARHPGRRDVVLVGGAVAPRLVHDAEVHPAVARVRVDHGVPHRVERGGVADHTVLQPRGEHDVHAQRGGRVNGGGIAVPPTAADGLLVEPHAHGVGAERLVALEDVEPVVGEHPASRSRAIAGPGAGPAAATRAVTGLRARADSTVDAPVLRGAVMSDGEDPSRMSRATLPTCSLVLVSACRAGLLVGGPQPMAAAMMTIETWDASDGGCPGGARRAALLHVRCGRENSPRACRDPARTVKGSAAPYRMTHRMFGFSCAFAARCLPRTERRTGETLDRALRKRFPVITFDCASLRSNVFVRGDRSAGLGRAPATGVRHDATPAASRSPIGYTAGAYGNLTLSDPTSRQARAAVEPAPPPCCAPTLPATGTDDP